MLVLGATAVDTSREAIGAGTAGQSMTELDSRASHVGPGGTSSATVPLGTQSEAGAVEVGDRAGGTNVAVHGRFYRAWGRSSRSAPAGTVSDDHAADAVTLTLVVPSAPART